MKQNALGQVRGGMGSVIDKSIVLHTGSISLGYVFVG